MEAGPKEEKSSAERGVTSGEAPGSSPNPTGTSENNCPSGFALHEAKELDFCTHSGCSVTMGWGEGRGGEKQGQGQGAVKFLGISALGPRGSSTLGCSPTDGGNELWQQVC